MTALQQYKGKPNLKHNFYTIHTYIICAIIVHFFAVYICSQ